MPENLEVQKLLVDSDLLIAILQLQTYSEAGIADSSALIISVTLVRGMVARMCLGWVALKKRFFKANLTSLFNLHAILVLNRSGSCGCSECKFRIQLPVEIRGWVICRPIHVFPQTFWPKSTEEAAE